MSLHPEFPIVDGTYQMTKEWSIKLSEPHNRRIEEGSLVLWRPGFTVWVNVWNNDNKETVSERVSWLKKDISKKAFDLEESKDMEITRIGYRINEERPEGIVYAYYGFAINANGHVQISMYFDSEKDLSVAKSMLNGLSEVRP